MPFQIKIEQRRPTISFPLTVLKYEPWYNQGRWACLNLGGDTANNFLELQDPNAEKYIGKAIDQRT